MKRMGFTLDPGPLPFVTLRTQKWANRTWVGEIIEVHGEHGCTLPAQPALVMSIEQAKGLSFPKSPVPGIYGTQPLYAISLAPVPRRA